MTHVYVSVRLYGAVVEQRLLPVCDVMRLGESDDALVAFPGADLVLRRGGDALWVRGRQLGPGDVLDMSLGPVDVTIEGLTLHRSLDLVRLWSRVDDGSSGSLPMPDLRLLLATATIALAASFFEAAGGFVTTDPVASREVQTLLDQLAPVEEPHQNARIQAPEQLPGDDDLEVPVIEGASDEEWPPAVFITLQ